ncbi:alpha-L-rhamnosidase [Agromyces kandeliae]|uniref:alpha-L-rhamnosidase n=1 Tax=Agromyces kandeliae TaxID=2666141 RepID=A0A6L5R5J0_9MICO|nr:alpha-L-rhamnosidase [Agromyces kandeliae]MRX45239.1 Bacterial alpha-L-rhamnosidase [Agromyces kandeliae]
MISTTLRIEQPSGDGFVMTPAPPLTWTTSAETGGWMQASAEIECDGSIRAHVNGRASVLVPWPFPPLSPRETSRVRVRVFGVDGSSSDWSEPVDVVGGFLEEGDWTAHAIALPAPDDVAQPGLARTEFSITKEIRRATLYATALGAYQVAINGVDVDDQVLKPGWTSYSHRLVHETTDVTSLVLHGSNAIGIRFAGAWATESYGPPSRQQRVYADQPHVAAQLVLEFADGDESRVITDSTWRTATGAVQASGIYLGERFDARREHPGFALAGFDDSDWRPAAVVGEAREPEARRSPAVRRIEEIAVCDVLQSPSGRIVVDFGQNLVGRLRIRVKGPRGTTVMLRHAEVLEDGELAVRPLRNAAATDTYILRGENEESWEPEFTFHGFRYAEISGWPGDFDPDAVTAIVIHSDMERTGWFGCSDPLITRLHENAVWSMRGNFLSLPTDCPQRDERLGWTGDIQVFAPTAASLFDVRGFLASWLRDLTLEQQAAEGIVPFVVPNVLSSPVPAAAWGDAATVVPWVLYERYDDRALLADQFASASAWLDVIARRAGPDHLWSGDFQFGDWLDPTAPPENAGEGATNPDIVATAYLFRSAQIASRMAAIVGRTTDAERFEELAESVKRAFVDEYVTPAGRMMSDSQTAYALALQFDLAPEDRRQIMAARLAELVRENGYRIGTGFVGTPVIQDALTGGGKMREAARLLMQTENPSWLYAVSMGATTTWERWDSLRPDGSVNPGGMTSFNHYAFGAIADWLHRVVGGLAPAEAGYRVMRIAPTPLPGIDHAFVEHTTPYGRARVDWRRAGQTIIVVATVPPNTTAQVELPDGQRATVGSGKHRWSAAAPSEPEREPISLASSLAELIDQPSAYHALRDSLDEVEPGLAEEICAHTRWLRGRTVAELLGEGRRASARDGLERRLDALRGESVA